MFCDVVSDAMILYCKYDCVQQLLSNFDLVDNNIKTGEKPK